MLSALAGTQALPAARFCPQRTLPMEAECDECEAGIPLRFDPLFAVWFHDETDNWVGETVCMRKQSEKENKTLP
jgi:hypothetical protein